MTESVDVVVIGAGISGLSAARGAQAGGASVLVLEASATIGGVMQTETHDGFLIEHGPTSMQVSPATARLLTEVGLASELITPDPMSRRRYVVRNGDMLPLPASPPSFVRTPLLSVGAKLCVLREPFVSRRHGPEADADESLASLVRRRLGSEILDFVIDPFVSGVCAGDPEELSSRHTFRILEELERTHGSIVRGMLARARKGPSGALGIRSLRSGMGALPHALAETLAGGGAPTGTGTPGRIRTGARVTSMAGSAERWVVTFEHQGRTCQVEAASVVCTVPAHALPRMRWPGQLQSPIEQCASVRYAPVATVALAIDRATLTRPLNGFGVLCPSRERRSILGALFNSAMFAGRAPARREIVTAFVGGSRMQALPAREEIEAETMREVMKLLRLRTAPRVLNTAAWNHGIPQLQVGHDALMRAADTIENIAPGVIVAGSWRTGVSIGDCLEHGMVAGGRAALRVKHIQQRS
ncbi:MAG: protoporphyrinogen oxidase [Gemmatimonas sp.]